MSTRTRPTAAKTNMNALDLAYVISDTSTGKTTKAWAVFRSAKEGRKKERKGKIDREKKKYRKTKQKEKWKAVAANRKKWLLQNGSFFHQVTCLEAVDLNENCLRNARTSC